MRHALKTVTVGDERMIRQGLEVVKPQIHDGSSRKRADAKRDGHSET
jgi:hypothetical protein